MKIKKVYQGQAPENKIVDAYSTSNTDAYSCNYINTNITNMLLNYCHPVGSVYATTNSSFNPNTSWGGTWEKITADAYFKIVSSNAGNLGGTSSSHKIPISSIPSHRHQYYNTWMISAGAGSASKVSGMIDDGFSGSGNYTNYEGGSQAYYPYYYGIYAWHRTA